MVDVLANEAILSVTYAGQQGELKAPVPLDASDVDLRAWAKEALQGGDIAGIGVQANADLTDYVVDRFPPHEERPYNSIALRPKTPFGG